MYEICRDALFELRKLIVFGAQIEEELDAELVMLMYDGMFDKQTRGASPERAVKQIMATTRELEKKTLVSALIGDKEFEEIQRLTYKMQSMMMNVVHGDDFVRLKNEYCALCDAFYNGTYQKLSKKVKV